MVMRLEDEPLSSWGASSLLGQVRRGALGRGVPGRPAVLAVGSLGRVGVPGELPAPFPPRPGSGSGWMLFLSPWVRLQMALCLSSLSSEAQASKRGRCPLPEPSPSSRLSELYLLLGESWPHCH